LKPIFTEEEVKRALFQMHPSKAPGVHGFTAGFYQRHWNLVGPELCGVVLGFLNGGEMPEEINDTAITLIPKVRNPQSIKKYRPISLCTVLYKIATKTVANRMRPVLEYTISQEQSAFVLGRLISDNALVAFECVHAMKRKKKGKKGHCAVKLDMMKAYDRVEWPFVESILTKFGFPPRLVQIIMKCVSTVRFSVKVNGGLLEPFTPRGIRQGDPMSPYLFLACAKGLTALIHHYNSGFIDRGVRVCKRSPWISHLLFADDSLIFINANGASAARLNEIMDIYHLASGQKVNKEKCAIFFSPCTSDTHREVVKQHLNIHIAAFSEKYLGLPTAVGKLTSEAFEYITESARSSVNGWAQKNLSYPGKEALIKSVVQAKPIHGMSCFLLSKSTCKKFTSVMGQFWWSGNLDRRSMHWLAWDKLAIPKNQGGMGFRDMQAFNVALLGKQAWRIIMKPDSLCSLVRISP
jgi:hypothetical protein